jgi:hypothetical protein
VRFMRPHVARAREPYSPGMTSPAPAGAGPVAPVPSWCGSRSARSPPPPPRSATTAWPPRRARRPSPGRTSAMATGSASASRSSATSSAASSATGGTTTAAHRGEHVEVERRGDHGRDRRPASPPPGRRVELARVTCSATTAATSAMARPARRPATASSATTSVELDRPQLGDQRHQLGDHRGHDDRHRGELGTAASRTTTASSASSATTAGTTIATASTHAEQRHRNTAAIGDQLKLLTHVAAATAAGPSWSWFEDCADRSRGATLPRIDLRTISRNQTHSWPRAGRFRGTSLHGPSR